MKFLNIACGDYFVLDDSWCNIDFSPKSKAIKQGDILSGLPYEDSSFDMVYSSHFIEHISKKDVVNFLIDCRRVLKPGGLIRLVLPNFENIAREYINNIEKGEYLFSEFNVIEMIDQCVRTESGGEMVKWFRQSQNSLLQNYIQTRTGHNFNSSGKKSNLILKIRNISLKKVILKIQMAYSRVLISFLPNWFVSNHISKAETGEKHLWMYDFNSLSNLLQNAQFVSIIETDSHSSSNSLFPVYPLDIDSNKNPRKGQQSMYIEARKLIA